MRVLCVTVGKALLLVTIIVLIGCSEKPDVKPRPPADQGEEEGIVPSEQPQVPLPPREQGAFPDTI